MAEMTDNRVKEIIGIYIGENGIGIEEFPSVTSVDEFSSVLLVQPTGAGNRIPYGVFKNQVVAEIKEPADKVINEVKEAGKEAALVVEAATKAVGDANTAASSADEAARVAEQAAANVKDGKTPVFGNVTAKDGDKAAATYTLNGVDANGNPVIDVDFTLEKGADGKHPVLQSGNITTLAPSEKVQASFRANGFDADGRPIYLVDLAIPKGDKGQAGDGSGNVLVNTSSLKKDARYLFTPKADGSAEGSFVEAKTSLITNDSKFQTASDVKNAIDAKVSYLTGSNTITTLTSIPTDKRILLATLSAATDITLKETLEVGKELLISINPTVDFEQPLPVSGGWQSLDGDTLSLKANKPAELSVLCVGDNKYILSSKIAE